MWIFEVAFIERWRFYTGDHSGRLHCTKHLNTTSHHYFHPNSQAELPAHIPSINLTVLIYMWSGGTKQHTLWQFEQLKNIKIHIINEALFCKTLRMMIINPIMLLSKNTQTCTHTTHHAQTHTHTHSAHTHTTHTHSIHTHAHITYTHSTHTHTVTHTLCTLTAHITHIQSTPTDSHTHPPTHTHYPHPHPHITCPHTHITHTHITYIHSTHTLWHTHTVTHTHTLRHTKTNTNTHTH